MLTLDIGAYPAQILSLQAWCVMRHCQLGLATNNRCWLMHVLFVRVYRKRACQNSVRPVKCNTCDRGQNSVPIIVNSSGQVLETLEG